MITGFDDSTLKHTIQDHKDIGTKKNRKVEEIEIDKTHKEERRLASR